MGTIDLRGPKAALSDLLKTVNRVQAERDELAERLSVKDAELVEARRAYDAANESLAALGRELVRDNDTITAAKA